MRRFDGTPEKKNGLPVTAKNEKDHGYKISNIRQPAGASQ